VLKVKHSLGDYLAGHGTDSQSADSQNTDSQKDS